jgi:hypothetical protein
VVMAHSSCFYRREWKISALQQSLASKLIRVRYIITGRRIFIALN